MRRWRNNRHSDYSLTS